MKIDTATLGVVAALLLSPIEATHASSPKLDAIQRRHEHQRRAHSSPRERTTADVGAEDLKKRGTQCPFPTDAGLVSVTPNEQNAGWAMSPDQPCEPGNYCPYACPPGQVSMQWDPEATSYTYPQSMNGGLYCDDNGVVSKPFPSKPYCADGTGALGATNNAGAHVAFCQTVLPGNEAMLIPTSVDSWAQLAVPGTSYWCETAAHFYINPPGVSIEDGCIWGDGSDPIGNWSPYVAGANTDANGNTFAKIAWNPIYIASNFANTLPDWGVSIECDGDGCNGLPCSIDPASNGINEVTSPDQASGAGGGNFCVVTIPEGVTANVVVFQSGGSSSGGSSSKSSASSSAAPSTSSSATPTSTSASSTSSSSSSTSTTSSSSSSTASSTSTTSTSSSSTSYSSSSSHSPSSSSSSSTFYSSSSSSYSASSTSHSVSSTASSTKSSSVYTLLPSDAPHIFVQNATSTSAYAAAAQMTSASATVLTTTSKKTSDAPTALALSTACSMVVFLATAISVLL